jgi:hypothetical protein
LVAGIDTRVCNQSFTTSDSNIIFNFIIVMNYEILTRIKEKNFTKDKRKYFCVKENGKEQHPGND